MTSSLLLRTQLKMLRPLKRQLLLRLTLPTFQPQYDLTRSLRLLMKHRLCLTTKSHLLRIVAAFSLCEVTSFSGFVLSDFVWLVLAALTTRAVGLAFFGYVYHGVGSVCTYHGTKKV